MNYLEINGEMFGSNDLICFVSTKLTEIGIHSFRSIHIDVQNNLIDIHFDDRVDADITKALAGLPQQNNNNHFQSRDAKLFMLTLHETSAQEGYC